MLTRRYSSSNVSTTVARARCREPKRGWLART
jgi:hypothetical protein